MEIKSQKYSEKINNIKTTFLSALDDFKKYYVYHNKNPEVIEFQNYYLNTKSQLQNLNKELFLTTNEINSGIDELQKFIEDATKKIKMEKKYNANLISLLSGLKNVHNGSEILIGDYKTIYNTQYYTNWEMILGIIIVGFFIKKLYFKNKT
jgi:hypothetical protein